MSATMPLARQDGLLVQPIENETVVYDSRTNKAYLLSLSAAAVWEACDGQRTVPEIARHVSGHLPISEEGVWYALGQLDELLEEPAATPKEWGGITRRQFLKRTGLVAAAATIPVVVKMVAPTPAAAQSSSSACCLCVGGSDGILSDCAACDAFCANDGGVAFCNPLPGLCII